MGAKDTVHTKATSSISVGAKVTGIVIFKLLLQSPENNYCEVHTYMYYPVNIVSVRCSRLMKTFP